MKTTLLLGFIIFSLTTTFSTAGVKYTCETRVVENKKTGENKFMNDGATNTSFIEYNKKYVIIRTVGSNSWYKLNYDYSSTTRSGYTYNVYNIPKGQGVVIYDVGEQGIRHRLRDIGEVHRYSDCKISYGD